MHLHAVASCTQSCTFNSPDAHSSNIQICLYVHFSKSLTVRFLIGDLEAIIQSVQRQSMSQSEASP